MGGGQRGGAVQNEANSNLGQTPCSVKRNMKSHDFSNWESIQKWRRPASYIPRSSKRS